MICARHEQHQLFPPTILPTEAAAAVTGQRARASIAPNFLHQHIITNQQQHQLFIPAADLTTAHDGTHKNCTSYILVL